MNRFVKTYVIGFVACAVIFFACDFESTTTNMTSSGAFRGSGSGTSGGSDKAPQITAARDNIGDTCNNMESCQFSCATSYPCGPYTFIGSNFVSSGNNSFRGSLIYQSGSQTKSAGTVIDAACYWNSSSMVTCFPQCIYCEFAQYRLFFVAIHESRRNDDGIAQHSYDQWCASRIGNEWYERWRYERFEWHRKFERYQYRQ